MPVIGFLSAETFERVRDYVAAFHRGLADGGFAEGRNVGIEYRWSEGHNDRLPALAADLVRRQVTVIAAASTPASLSAKAATQTIPIVFYIGTDPVGVGLVASLAHPGGNITGVTNLSVELFKKCFELMHSLMSGVFTEAALKFLSCAVADAESTASSSAVTEMLATWCRSVAGVIDRPPILSRAVSSMFRRWYDGTISHVTHPGPADIAYSPPCCFSAMPTCPRPVDGLPEQASLTKRIASNTRKRAAVETFR